MKESKLVVNMNEIFFSSPFFTDEVLRRKSEMCFLDDSSASSCCHFSLSNRAMFTNNIHSSSETNIQRCVQNEDNGKFSLEKLFKSNYRNRKETELSTKECV